MTPPHAEEKEREHWRGLDLRGRSNYEGRRVFLLLDATPSTSGLRVTAIAAHPEGFGELLHPSLVVI